MNLRQAAQQALEALEKCSDWPGAYDACSRAVDNLRAALAEPQTTHWEGCEAVHPECRKPDTDCHAQGICQRSGYSIAPPQRKPDLEALNAELVEALRDLEWAASGVEYMESEYANELSKARAALAKVEANK